MKDQLSALDLHHLVREMQSLVGARVDKAYQGTKERKRDILLVLRKPGEKLLLRILLPGLVYIAPEKPVYDRLPGQFAVQLRKRMGNARLVAVRQRGFDRILELGLENKDGKMTFLLELIPPGNALLLDAEEKILAAMEQQKTSTRTIRPGQPYVALEPAFPTNTASAKQLAEKLMVTDKDAIVKSLAIDLGLGGAYAEEACARAAVEKATAKLTKAELHRVAEAVRNLVDAPISPQLAGAEGFPIQMITRKGEKRDSFSEIIASLVPVPEEPEDPDVAESAKHRKKALSVVEQQKKAFVGLEKSGTENQRKAELLYERYQEIVALLKEAKQAKTKEEIAALEAKHPILKNVDKAKGEITVEF